METIKALVSHRRYVFLIGCIAILTIALSLRTAFYIDPKHVDKLMFYELGGSGDYDYLVRHTLRYLMLHDKLTYFWSLAWEYPILLRLFAFFFSVFGFVKGYGYLFYFLIVVGSLTTLMPFIILSRYKKYSLGGFIGSLFLACNPMLVRLPSSFAVDTVTSVFFSGFIIFYILALEKRRLMLAVLLGVVGFIDAFDRVLMIINDIPALVAFAGLFVFINKKPQRKFPFFTVKKADLIYAFIPITVMLTFYIGWEVYYYVTFHLHWFLGTILFETHTTLVGLAPDVTVKTIALWQRMSNIIINVGVLLVMFYNTIALPLWLLVGLIAVLCFQNLKKMKRKNAIILSALPLLFVMMIYLFANFSVFLPYLIPPASVSRIAKLSISHYISLFWLLEFFVVIWYFLRLRIVIAFTLIAAYFMMVAYGLYSFSERHTSQMLFIFGLILGWAIDDLAFRKYFSSLKRTKFRLMPLGLVGGFTIYFGLLILPVVGQIYHSVALDKEQNRYLQFAGVTIPHDGIILSGPGDNLVSVVSQTKKSVVYNVSHEALYIPYGKKHFAVPVASTCFITNCNYDIVDRTVEFDFVAALNDNTLFEEHKFYVLDTNLEVWHRMLTTIGLHPFIPPNRYRLEPVATDTNGRGVYKLVLAT